MSFGTTERGTWQLSAELPADEGALVERALVAARDESHPTGERLDPWRVHLNERAG